MTQTKLPSVAFAFRINTWEYFERMWNKPMYKGYGTWDILTNELYDFTY